LGGDHSARINSLVTDIIDNSGGREEIIMSGKFSDSMNKLRGFMFEHVYHNLKVKKYEDLDKVESVIEFLYVYYNKNAIKLPEELYAMTGEFGVSEMVKDYIAGMTDRFALNLYYELNGD
jgi:dGTPase